MPSKGGGQKKAKENPPAPAEQPETPEAPVSSAASVLMAVFRPQILLGLAMMASAVAFGPQFLRALPDLNERPEYRILASQIQVTPTPPRWVPENFTAIVLEEAGMPRELSLLEPDLVAKLADAFRRHPWVADVIQVRKRAPAGLDVELRFRQPIAVVEVPDGLYPVDRSAVLLPPADLAPAEARRYPLIQNVASLPGAGAGALWGDVSVVGAARLAAVLQDSVVHGDSAWKRFGLAAIRVPRRAPTNPSLDDVLLELVSAGGSRILWGRPPGTSHPGELSVEQKLGRLERYVKDYGGFDQPHGPYEIDIRHWQEISRRSLAGTPRTRH